MSVRLEIRCCCNPRNLIGFVTVPEYPHGRFAMLPTIHGAQIQLEVARYHPSYVLHSHPPEGSISVPPSSYYALKSHELPIEVFRQLVGFEENEDRL